MIESKVQQIPYSQESVFNTLSDFNNLKLFADRIPQDQLKDLKFDSDSLSCSVPMAGQVTLRIIERQPCKCIKLVTDKSPVSMTMWIQIVPTGTDSCKMKLTLDVGMNGIMAKMIEKPLREGIEKIAFAFASIPYSKL